MARPFCAAEAEAVCEIPFPWDGPVRTPVCLARIPNLCLGLSSDRPVFLVLAYYLSFHFRFLYQCSRNLYGCCEKSKTILLYFYEETVNTSV